MTLFHFSKETVIPRSNSISKIPRYRDSLTYGLFICSICVSEKLLLTSLKTQDYNFLVKGCETADGIDDHEEFKATEVKKSKLIYPTGPL